MHKAFNPNNLKVTEMLIEHYLKNNASIALLKYANSCLLFDLGKLFSVSRLLKKIRQYAKIIAELRLQ